MSKPAKFAPNLRMKQARVQRGWSQEYVARAIGTDAFTVSRWERGVAMASPHFRQQLCVLFDLSVAQLGLIPADMQTPDVQATCQPDEMTTQPPSTQSSILDPGIPPALGHSLVGRDSPAQAAIVERELCGAVCHQWLTWRGENRPGNGAGA